MDKKLTLALKQSFSPPPTQQREEFINYISYPTAKFSEVLISQIGYIRKRVWLIFALSACFTFFYTKFVETPKNIVMGVSAVLPFLSLCIIAEIFKSRTYNMEETEFACKYSFPKIILMRLSVLGTASFVMLILFVIIIGKSDFGIFRNTIYIGVPYLCSSYLSLLIISKFHSKEIIYVCTAVSGAVSGFIIVISSNYQIIYQVDFMFIWVILFVTLIGLFFYRINRVIKSQEELQWNFV